MQRYDNEMVWVNYAEHLEILGEVDAAGPLKLFSRFARDTPLYTLYTIYYILLLLLF